MKLREELAKAKAEALERVCSHRIVCIERKRYKHHLVEQRCSYGECAVVIWEVSSTCSHVGDVQQGDTTVADKAEESLEAIRTGRIDAGDLKRLSPFAGVSSAQAQSYVSLTITWS